MTVSAINGSSSWPVSAQTPPSPPPMTNTAKLLGLSTDQLNQDLQSGTTLSSLASQEGVSSSSLISSIESDLQANAPQGAPALSSSQLTQMATDIANGTPPVGGGSDQGGVSAGGATSARAQSNLSSLASTLGTDPSTLFSQLTSGQDLSSLLSAGSGAGYGSSLITANTGGIAFDEYA